MQRWFERFESNRSRPLGWVMAATAAIMFITAFNDFLNGAPEMLAHVLLAIGSLVVAFLNLRPVRRPGAMVSLSLFSLVCLLVSLGLQIAAGLPPIQR